MISMKLDDVVITFDEPISKTLAKQIVKSTIVVAQRKRELDYEFCERLYATREQDVKDSSGKPVKIFQAAGYKTWKEFVEQELGILFEKAKWYASIVEFFGVEMHKTFDKKNVIELNKMHDLMRDGGIQEDNVNSVLQDAKHISTAKFKALLGRPPSNSKTVRYSFPSKDEKKRTKSFRIARGKFGNDLTEGQLHILMCEEFSIANS